MRSFTIAGMAWVAGVALQLQQPALWQGSQYLVLAGISVLLLIAHVRAVLPAPAWLYVALAVLAFAITGERALHRLGDRLAAELDGPELVVTGTVEGLPQWRADGARFQFAVEEANWRGRRVEVPRRLSLSWPTRGQVGAPAPPAAGRACASCVQPGQRWQFPVRLRQPHGNRNPFGFDLELWMWQQEVGASGQVRAAPGTEAAQRLHDAPWYRLDLAMDRARLQVRERLLNHVVPAGQTTAAAEDRQRVAGVLAALVMGDQAAIERQDWDIFRRTGVAHLMSISGLHVTMFAWLAGGLVGWAWRRSARREWPLCLWLPAPQAGLWGGVLLALLYAWFAGWGVPAQRTVCMLLVVALLRGGGKQWPWHAIWAMAAMAVTLLDPWALLQPGFWLSFVAVAMLFITGDEQVPPAPHWRARVWHAIRAFLHQQWVVVLALTPLAMLMFGQFSIAGVLANMLAVPLVTVLVTPLALLGVLLPPLWLLAADLLQLLNAMLEWMAAWPWAMHAAALAPLWVGVAGLAGGLLLAVRLPLPWRLQGLVWLAPVLLWQSVRPAPGEFELLMVDIGQGGAVLVRTASHSLLYDTGARHSDRSDAGQRILVPLLAALDEQIDRLVLSHADNDHAGGASAVLQAQPQATVMGSLPPGHVLHTSPGVAACQSGQHWTWDGVRFDVLHPAPGTPLTADNTNASSCVLRIGNGRRSALLAGDIELEQEQQLVQRLGPEQLQADVLLAAHHGSGTSTGADWLQAVQPRWTLIQHGYRNNYGHPHVPVLQRLLEQGSTIVQTDQCGAGWWRSDSNQVRCERERNRRYWQHDVPLAPVRLQDPADRPG